MTKTGMIVIKTKEEIQILREAGQILGDVMSELITKIKPGMTTLDVDRETEELIAAQNVIAAFKGYRGFPGSACVSVNEEIVHGIPRARVLKEGDIISVDVGVIYQDYYSDTATTIPVGRISSADQKLLNVTKKSLELGIDQARPNNRLSDISAAIQKHVESNHLAIVRDFVGHGIGKDLHEDPEIPNYGRPHQGPVLKEGMVFAIEPMVNIGTYKTKILKDGWTVATGDGKNSAHFEHTVAILENGPEILTKY